MIREDGFHPANDNRFDSGEGWAIRWELSDDALHVDFQICENGSDNPYDDDVDFSGAVKWDGCINWEINGVGHFCDIEDVALMQRQFAKVWEIAKKAMPKAIF